jgi:glycosyltransferase involved in cell wall biosynthesis
MTPVEPLVSINIPCYHQLQYATLAVTSILNQSLSSLEVTLLDDGASDDYARYVATLGDPRVHYHRNVERLGAMRNMFSAITAGRGPYTMAFHEDDLLSTSYLASALALLERHPACAFVACQLREFEDEPSAQRLGKESSPVAHEMFASAADLVRGILRGVEPMFGSVVYRRSVLDGVEPDHERYATLVDRPFLLAIMDRGWTAAVIQAPLVWYRHHGDGDTRHLAMASEHILHLLRTYRSKLPADWTTDDRTLFFTYSGYWLFELYRLTPPERRPPVWKYLLRAWRQGLYDPRARGRFGVRQIQRALLNQTS